jgi:tRNA(Arg) A34 adenosine deaminase TadA/6-pyruvoyl-tetrahydropterin synthase
VDANVVTIGVSRDAFTFAAAHMTALPDQVESLHGHNYTVDAMIRGVPDRDGLLVDFRSVRTAVQLAVRELDNRLLLARDCPDVEIAHDGLQLRISIRPNRKMVIPAQDVVILPIVNTSVEELARCILERVVTSLFRGGNDRSLSLGIRVGEFGGQWAEVWRDMTLYVDPHVRVDTNEEGIALAVSAARSASARGESPFGAVVAGRGFVRGSGGNETRSSGNPLRHAEIVAIQDAMQAGPMSGDVILYSSCEPCTLCLAACYYAGVTRVVYAATLRDAIAMGSGDPDSDQSAVLELLPGIELVGPVGRDAAVAMMEEHVAREGRL